MLTVQMALSSAEWGKEFMSQTPQILGIKVLLFAVYHTIIIMLCC